jgi:ferric-dicitrate binding protein FerR (iron transport regulator)
VDDEDLSEEAKALIQGFVEGALTSAECRRLRELIRRNPSVARLIADGVRMDGEIRELTPVRIRRTSRRLRPRYRPADRSSVAWVATAAGILILVVMALQEGPKARREHTPVSKGIVFVSSQPAPAPSTFPEPVPEPKPQTMPPVQGTTAGFAVQESLVVPVSPSPVVPSSPPSVANLPTPDINEGSVPPSTKIAPVVLASIEDATQAVLISDGTRTPISGSGDLFVGQALETGSSGRAVLVYADQTRVELNPGTTISNDCAKRGKALCIERGTVRAVVTRQPKGDQVVFASEHGTATVLGTVLRIAVVPGNKGSMLLQVIEGKVALKNRSGDSAEVRGGFQAIASRAPKVELKTMNAEGVLKNQGRVTISFGPEGRRLPAGCAIDSGLPFDFDRGYGWEQQKVECAEYTHAFTKESDDLLKKYYVAAGTANSTTTWWMRVPNGKYRITACVGGEAQNVPDQGPHHVVVQETIIIENRMTLIGEFFANWNYVKVTDGRLKLVLGGHGSKKKTPTDKDDDTILSYITIEAIR